MPASDLTMMVDWNTKRLAEDVDRVMLADVIPTLRLAVEAAALKLVPVPSYDNPFARYAAAELVIKALADLITLTDTEEMTLLSPTMLADEKYTTYWIEQLS